MKNYYDVLGVNEQSTSAEITKAFKDLAKKHHPDRGGDKDKFQEISEAHDTLKNSQKRHDYDTMRKFGNANTGGGQHPFFNEDIFGEERMLSTEYVFVEERMLSTTRSSTKTYSVTSSLVSREVTWTLEAVSTSLEVPEVKGYSDRTGHRPEATGTCR